MFDDFNDADDLGIISFHECTGLMPALPQSEYEWESYQALYATELNAAALNLQNKDNIYPDDEPVDENP